MKRLLLFFILLVIPIFVNADEINCADHPYACVECTYGDLTFITYSNGEKVDVDIRINPAGSYTVRKYENLASANFILDNKLSCPAKIYYTMSVAGRTIFYTYSFVAGLNSNLFDKDLSNSYNNGKNIYDNPDKNILSCKYIHGISLVTDGTDVWVENY